MHRSVTRPGHVLAPVLVAIGCRYAGGSPRAEYVPSRAAEASELAHGPISATFAHDDGASPTHDDCIVVVFDRELDAASLQARSFLVVLGDGSRVFAETAVLAPASEDDENRSVWLYGDFGDPLHRPPTDVVVVAPVWAEDGRETLGAAVKVAAHDRPAEVVATELLAPGEARCPGARQLVRLYWSETIRGVEADDRPRFELTTSAGATIPPSAFDDVPGHGTDPIDDNVLDLCVADGAELRELRIAQGAIQSVEGRGNGALRIALPEPSSPERPTVAP